MRFGTGTENHALIGDMQRLTAEIQQYNANQQRRGRPCHQRQRPPGYQQHRQGRGAGALPISAIGPFTGTPRCQSADDPDQAQGANLSMGKAKGRSA